MHAARLYRPMSGNMAARFTRGQAIDRSQPKKTLPGVEYGAEAPAGLRPGITKDELQAKKTAAKEHLLEKPSSSASVSHLDLNLRSDQQQQMEEAAKAGMFGPLTRRERTWVPERILYKRFNVAYPTV